MKRETDFTVEKPGVHDLPQGSQAGIAGVPSGCRVPWGDAREDRHL